MTTNATTIRTLIENANDAYDANAITRVFDEIERVARNERDDAYERVTRVARRIANVANDDWDGDAFVRATTYATEIAKFVETFERNAYDASYARDLLAESFARDISTITTYATNDVRTRDADTLLAYVTTLNESREYATRFVTEFVVARDEYANAIRHESRALNV